MSNDLNNLNCSNLNCLHLDHGIENKPEIGLLNTTIDRLKEGKLLLENLDRKVNYTVLRIFALQEELSKIQGLLERINSDLHRLTTLEKILTLFVGRMR